VARLVRAEAGSGQGSSLVTADVAQACRRLSVLEVGPLAERLSSPYTRDDLVVSPELRRELDLVTAWSRHGLRAFDGAGPGRNLRVGPGLACLFHGPPGTGKTMAAQALARDAGFEIYRIDLSQVVNKYIGETEKNLSRVFDAAEDANCLLFFDEADSLFGRRSEIKDAHDRYANIETGYLLQRLESYRGLVILATNLRKNLDEAFLRRLQVVAEFPIPSPAERSRIWSRLLPSRAERAADVDVELLSERFAVAGGSIKNAIFTATLLAAEAGSPLGMRHLMLGLSRELKKSGRVADASAFAGWMPEPARGA
jgi:SpoVK/Ycf46/Vps4 family AAA+-type ATPase